MLIIMGGSMGVYEEDQFDWMPAQKKFITDAIEAKKKVLGICLGAQFIAEALGAKVYPHIIKEIGWWEVEKVTPHPLSNHLPQTFTTFHWHGDTFTLPVNVIQLFKTKGCHQQGFVFQKHVAGLQFHFEVNEDLLNGMTKHEKSSLIKTDSVQTDTEIKTLMQQYITLQPKYLYHFLEAFLQL
ncbi:MAG: type 1 glutamine amidotransferase [Bacteroidetes bacterium]|nr:type 1 glutamine amidotransferase [Bacteroidota bacterium]